MVARRLFLLVAGVVLLVDDDEAEVVDGREDGRAGADDDAGFAASNAVPLFGALLGRERGVEQGDIGAEGVMQLRGHGGGEADFRDEQDGGFARSRARCMAAR